MSTSEDESLDRRLLSDLYREYRIGWEKLLRRLALPTNIGIVKTMTVGEAKAFAGTKKRVIEGSHITGKAGDSPHEQVPISGLSSSPPAAVKKEERLVDQILSVLRAASGPLKAKDILAQLRQRGQRRRRTTAVLRCRDQSHVEPDCLLRSSRRPVEGRTESIHC